MSSLESIRVVVVEVYPLVVLFSVLDEERLEVDASKELRELLASLLGQQVEVALELHRGESKVTGRMLEVHEVSSCNDPELWRAWFAKNAGHWEQVEDIEAELGRDTL